MTTPPDTPPSPCPEPGQPGPQAATTAVPIERFLSYMHRLTFRAGEVLFRQGDPADTMFYIQQGAVNLVEIQKTLGAGEFLGEMGLLCPANLRTVSAVCDQDLVAYRMDLNGVLAMMDHAPRDIFALIQLAIGRYAENLRNETAARARMESELQVAHTIQSSSLPNAASAFPTQTAFDLHADMTPAREVGGDFYDFFLIDPNTLFIAVGDVSGKGVPSALFMMTVRAMLKAEAMSGRPPSEVLRRLNRLLCPDNTTFMFVTILCAVVNLATGQVLFGNGGHCPPLVRLGTDLFRYLEVPPSPVVGVRPDAVFSSASLTLRPGDTLLFYTDGVTEATNETGAFFEEDRLLASVRRAPPSSMEKLVAEIENDVTLFADGTAQSDDITVLALRFFGKSDSAPSTGTGPFTQPRISICTMPATTDNMPAFHALVACGANPLGFSPERMADIELAVEEVLANIIHHAYPDMDGTIELRCSADDANYILQFIDHGIPFDATAAHPPRLPSDITRREIGGLGIYLVKQLVDTVAYRREEGRNILTLCVRRPDNTATRARKC